MGPPLRLLITNGVIWNPYDWLNKFYSFYMATILNFGMLIGLALQLKSVIETNIITVSYSAV